jgi:hypothetical protein
MGAIASAQRGKDAVLEEDARRNLQLLIHERQKQKQQQKEEQQKNKQDKKQDDKQNAQQDQNSQGGQQNPDKNPDEKKGQQDKPDNQDKKGDQSEQAKIEQKRYEDPSKSRQRQFNSPKLTKDDAERVMAELSSREKDLQARIKKQNGTPQQRQNDKDW